MSARACGTYGLYEPKSVNRGPARRARECAAKGARARPAASSARLGGRSVVWPRCCSQSREASSKEPASRDAGRCPGNVAEQRPKRVWHRSPIHRRALQNWGWSRAHRSGTTVRHGFFALLTPRRESRKEAYARHVPIRCSRLRTYSCATLCMAMTRAHYIASECRSTSLARGACRADASHFLSYGLSPTISAQ